MAFQRQENVSKRSVFHLVGNTADFEQSHQDVYTRQQNHNPHLGYFKHILIKITNKLFLIFPKVQHSVFKLTWRKVCGLKKKSKVGKLRKPGEDEIRKLPICSTKELEFIL